MWKQLPCAIYRGGTSRAVFFDDKDLPADPTVRDRVLLSVIGSPDPNQINGLGGANITSSKVAIVKKSVREDADIEYTHGQVDILNPFIDYAANGGNISAAIGPFAVDRGMFAAHEGEVCVRIYNTNTQTLFAAHFPVVGGMFYPEGNTVVPGVPGTASEVRLDYFEPAGGVTGTLFPTGRVLEEAEIDGKTFNMTVIDAGNLSVIVRADELGMTGSEITQDDIVPTLPLIEKIRWETAKRLERYLPQDREALSKNLLPKVEIVSPPLEYVSRSGEHIDKARYSIWARDITVDTLHPSYPLTGGIAMGIASLVPGTVAHACAGLSGTEGRLHIGHPSGTFEIGASVKHTGDQWQAVKVSLISTARPIIDGKVWVPDHLFE